ncbi:MAG: metallophosphoesterase [Deltaproteobacteria bacterium]|nr:metallophosphoesterase [Deltaproteobacteria bacterium]
MRASALAAGLIAVSLATPAWANGPGSAHYARGSKDVFWFLHITDIHVGSGIMGPDALPRLAFVLGEGHKVIKPVFVVATGDLNNGSLNHVLYAGQEPEDWYDYEKAYTDAGMLPANYHDLPGNHDGYGDIGLTWYLGHSLQGKTTGLPHGSWTHTTGLGHKIAFFGLNSAGVGQPAMSPQKPAFTAEGIAALSSGLEEHKDAALTIVFAHHPLEEPPGGAEVTTLLEAYGGAFYVHGHKHQLEEYLSSSPYIVSNQLKSLGQSDEQNLAVGVVDHNAFIYGATDVLAPWPLIVITAPVSHTLRGSETLNPWAYMVCKDRVDNPVRALVFSLDAPSSVTASVGGLSPVPLSNTPGSPSLWEGELDTTTLTAGRHELTVTATVGGKQSTKKITVPFSMGPCAPLPDDALVPDGGVGGSGGQGGSSGADGGGGVAGGGGAQAGGGGAPEGGAGAPAAGGSAQAGAGGSGTSGNGGACPAAPEESSGGCGCRTAPGSGGAFASVGALLILGFNLRRRRRTHSSDRSEPSRSR